MKILNRKRKRLVVAVVYGGRSGEHDVSLQSAASVLANLSKEKYTISELFVDHQGRWHAGRRGKQETAEKLLSGADVVLPLIHGTFGEDGCLPGMLEMLDVAYVGSGVLGSSVGMDKDTQKKILKHDGLPTVPWFALRRTDWRKSSDNSVRYILKALPTFPLFVKPANLGSSVGISKAHNRQELLAAIKLAFRYDDKIVIERAVAAPREIEVAVIGNERPRASVAGEVVSANEFYDYDAKYRNERSRAIAPAALPKPLIAKVRRLAIAAYHSLSASGFARVDFLLGKDGRLWLNEINTIPGFTARSMFPILWQVSGLSFARLLDELIALALKRRVAQSQLVRDYRVNKA